MSARHDTAQLSSRSYFIMKLNSLEQIVVIYLFSLNSWKSSNYRKSHLYLCWQAHWILIINQRILFSIQILSKKRSIHIKSENSIWSRKKLDCIVRGPAYNQIEKNFVEMPGIEPGASHMQSERSTTELHPPLSETSLICDQVI